MSEWKKSREKYVQLEKIGICAIIVCIILGISSDICVACGYSLVVIDDIEAFSLTVLQIQATIGTLTLTIIALITGNISDSNFGISVTDYYMNIRPKWLKQKRIIYISLLFILSGIFCFVLKAHNTLFFMFINTLIVVAISIAELYSAFNGKNETEHEIEEYIRDVQQRKGGIEEKKSLFHKFIDEWKKESSVQNQESYELFFDILKTLIRSLYCTGSDENLKYIQEQCYRIAYCLLSSSNKNLKERGIIFIQDVYEAILGEILDNKNITEKYSQSFSLLNDVSRELNEAIDSIEAEKMENIFHLDKFLKSVHGVDIWIGNDKRDLSEVHFLVRKLGYYLSKQKKMGNLIEYIVWLKPFKYYSLFSTKDIPEEKSEDYLNEQWSIYFDYCYGMIMYGMENVVIQGLYCRSIKGMHSLEYKQELLLYLSLHCYVYYLAECENENCVAESVRVSAKKVLYNEDTRKIFYNLLRKLSENSDFLTSDVPQKMETFLDKYELFPGPFSVKAMIMDSVVQEFYLFIILYIANRFSALDLLERNISGEFSSTYLGDAAEARLRNSFKKLYEIIPCDVGTNVETYNETIGMKAAQLYDNLRKIAVKQQKEHYIKLAREEQERYGRDIDQGSVCKEIERKVTEKIKADFLSILSEKTTDQIIEIPVLRLETYTGQVDTKCIDGFYSHISGQFLAGIVRNLREKNALALRIRDTGISGDTEYLEYLKANDFKILAGSESIFRSRSYQMSREIEEQLEKYETIYISGMWEGIALKENALEICLHEVKVSVKSVTIEESSAKYDEVKNKYEYAIINDVPLEFEKAELEEYLYNHRKKITVNAIVSIKINEKPVGTVFEGSVKMHYPYK